MKRTAKPVRRCHACLLNLGDHCWRFPNPRAMWRRGKTCPGFENPSDYTAFRAWTKMPSVKSRRDLRRDIFRTPRRKTHPGRGKIPAR